MLLFVAVMLPAIISVFIFERATGSDLKLKGFLYIYSASSLCVNLICAIFKRFVLNTADALLSIEGDMTPSAFFNYLVMAIPAAVVVGIFAALLKRENVTVTKE